ncbi:MAG: hypothetical protein WC748_05985 [Legionellales bacterium]
MITRLFSRKEHSFNLQWKLRGTVEQKTFSLTELNSTDISYIIKNYQDVLAPTDILRLMYNSQEIIEDVDKYILVHLFAGFSDYACNQTVLKH